MNRIIRSRELAKKLTISVPTLWRMEKRGELPPKIQITKKISGWRESDIEEWLKEREIKGSNDMEVIE